MNALVGYDSSDDEIEVGGARTDRTRAISKYSESHPVAHSARPEHAEPTAHDAEKPIVGPFGPLPSSPRAEGQEALRSFSPYTDLRSQLRDLTQPPIMIVDIPPSPPGSPNPTATSRITRFWELKKKGSYFNDDLGRKAMFRNPSLLAKMMENSGMDEHAQYATTLPESIWNPSVFPDWAYKEGLRQRQQAIRDSEEQVKRSAQGSRVIDWVSAGAAGGLSRSNTPSGGKPANTPEGAAAGLNGARTLAFTGNERGKRKRP